LLTNFSSTTTTTTTLHRNSESDPERKIYAMMLADTVLVTSQGPELLTKNDSAFESVSYTLVCLALRRELLPIGEFDPRADMQCV
jgi:hypothetical protein